MLCYVNVFSILTNEKHFLKTVRQGGFTYGLFTDLPRIIVAYDFIVSSLTK